MAQFAALLYGPDVDIRAPGMADLVDAMKAFRVSAGGHVVGGVPFATTGNAVTVRVAGRGGDLELRAGPCAATADALGGLFLLECDSLDEAVELATLIPNAWNGAVEVRPLLATWK